MIWYIPPINDRGIARRWHVWRDRPDTITLIDLMLEWARIPRSGEQFWDSTRRVWNAGNTWYRVEEVT